MADTSLVIAINANTTDVNTKMAVLKGALAQTTAELVKQSKAATQDGADLAAILPAVTKLTQAQSALRTEMKALTGEHGSHAAAVGSNRAAYMEFGHVAKSAFDSIAAGASPLRVVQFEGARAVQAFTELTAASRATIIAMVPVAGVVLAVGAALGTLAYKLASTEFAMRSLDNTTAAYGRSSEAVSGSARAMAHAVADDYWLSYSAGAKIAATFNNMRLALDPLRLGLARLTPAFAKLYGLGNEKGAENLAESFGTAEGIKNVLGSLHQLTEEKARQIDVDSQAGNLLGAQQIGYDTLTATVNRYTAALKAQVQPMVLLRSIGDILTGQQLPKAAQMLQADKLIPNGISDQDANAANMAEKNRDLLGVQKQIEDVTARRAQIEGQIADITKRGAENSAGTLATLKAESAGASDMLVKLNAKAEGGSDYAVIEENLKTQLRAKQLFGDQALAYEKTYLTQQLALVQGGGQNEAAARRRIGDELYAIEEQIHSKEAGAARRDTSADAQDEQRAQEQRNEIVRAGATQRLTLARLDVQAKKDALAEEVSDGKLTEAAKVAQEKDLVRQLADIDKGILDNEINMHTSSLVQIAGINNQKVVLAKQAELQMAQIDKEYAAEQARTAKETTAKLKQQDKEIANSAAQSLVGMLDGRQTFTQTAINLGERLVQRALAWGFEEVLNTIRTETLKTGAVAAGGGAQVAAKATAAAAGKAVDAAAGSVSVIGDAHKAAAGAYAAVVGIPIIGPVLAPLAAVTAFGAVAAFDVFSAEGGMARVPYDDAPALLHRNEMVLPAHLADTIRAGGGGGNFSPTVHVYGGNGRAPSTSDIIRELRNAHRNGAFA